MKIINIQEAKTHLSRLVEEVLKGEELVIAKAGKPLVKLVPFTAKPAARKLGFLAGQIWEAPDCWEPDLELEARFMGELPKWSEEEKAAAQAWLDARKTSSLSGHDITAPAKTTRVAEDEPAR